jgi:hypothetical protein
MGVVTDNMLAALRRDVAGASGSVHWGKGTINAAIRSIEDWFESQRSTVSGLIDEATAPVVFSQETKKCVVRHYLKQKSAREGQ